MGTMGRRVIGDIFATRSSRLVQSPAEEVVEAPLVDGALGDGALGGATLGGGQVGARAASGSSVAPLGGRTGLVFGEPGTEDPGTEDPGTEDPGTEDPGTEDPGTEDPGRYVTGPIGTIDVAPGTLGGARLVVGALAVCALLGHIPFGQFTAGFAVGFVVGEP
jgi:hypothetical protein